jgi:hypothetical protein
MHYVIVPNINLFVGNILENIKQSLENWCIVFNQSFLLFFQYVKYIFVFIIIFVGILTLLRLRGVFRQSRLKGIEKQDDSFTVVRVCLGCCYIFVGVGILFNYLTYFLIWILEPLPDKLIYNFLDFSWIDSSYVYGNLDVNNLIYPHEKTIYYCFAFGSLSSIMDILLSLWYLINNNKLINNPRKTMTFLIGGIIGGMVFGFTTCLSLFL